MDGNRSDAEDAASQAQAWKSRHDAAAVRAFAARQRDQAALGRRAAAAIRDEAALIRAEAAKVRDEGARTRDDAARVRDQAALVRDQAARARDEATKTRDEATRRRIAKSAPMSREDWVELVELDRVASGHSQLASARDREASMLDRRAAEKDREAAERDRAAANSDRLAADKDRDAADQDRAAAENDREAADADRSSSEQDLLRAEQRLTRSERLSALGRISAGIAHELNNPLAALQSNLSALEALLGKAQSTDVGGILADLRLSTDRISGVVEDMRSWVQGDAADRKRGPVDLARVLDEALKFAAHELEGRAVASVKLESLPPVWGIVQRLSQVFVNLLLNAVHAMPEARDGNEIRIRAAAEGAFVLVEVTDNGQGIPPDVLPHVFDPFFTTRESEGGTGLGLAMCEQVVTDHGGTITVESTPGVSTTFRIRLPAGLYEPPISVKPAAPRRARVLIIDDDAALTRSLGRHLGQRCDVTIAVNGQEGLQHLLAPGDRFDLVLCDLSMPVMNGRQMYEQLRKQAPELAPGVVFITGGALSRETEEFLAALPNTKLYKPFSHRALFDLLDVRLGAELRAGAAEALRLK